MLKSKIIYFFLFAAFTIFPVAAADVPEWVENACKEPLNKIDAESEAVILFKSQFTRLTETGKIITLNRLVYKILRKNAIRDLSRLAIFHNNELKIKSFRAWHITPENKRKTIKEKEAIETQLYEDSLYSDTHAVILSVPETEIGSIVA